MQLIKRISFYLIGLTIGIFLVSIIFKGKKVEFDYLPNARVLKNVRKKHRVFSDDAKVYMQNNAIDTVIISTILKHGEVDFNKSKPRQKPCREYWINSVEATKKSITLQIKVCDSISTIMAISLN